MDSLYTANPVWIRKMDKLDFYPFRRCSKRIDNGTKAASCRMHETDKRESHEINSTVKVEIQETELNNSNDFNGEFIG